MYTLNININHIFLGSSLISLLVILIRRLSIYLRKKNYMKKNNSLIKHAKRELKIRKELAIKNAIANGEEITEDFWDYDQMYDDNLLQLIKVFSKQNHSGFSASITISMFKILANLKH